MVILEIKIMKDKFYIKTGIEFNEYYNKTYKKLVNWISNVKNYIRVGRELLIKKYKSYKTIKK